ncbi:unnamed protein product [Macrosiphum euphorbiae]|uniref:Uncharacterized protein n=1 Tax=Macrosiphum euphorbiae TaxID=13131 RepID=A0AAV0X0M1_9HEMI|nr:unnamed protein product [Macrosiphum euphorbiae]
MTSNIFLEKIYQFVYQLRCDRAHANWNFYLACNSLVFDNVSGPRYFDNLASKTLNSKCLHDEDLELKNVQIGGSFVLNYFEKHNIINESCRNVLVEIIINDLIKREYHTTFRLANLVADAIIGTFPTEIKDTYFLKDAKKRQIIWIIRYMKQNGLIPAAIGKERSSKPLSRTMDKENSILATDPDSELVSTYLNDKDLTWPEIEEIWRKTINYRLNYIKQNNATDIFNKWQQYTQPMGYKLVDIDFQNVFSDYTNFKTVFEENKDNLINILKERVRDCESKKLLETFSSMQNMSTDSKTLIIMYLLHCFFIPTSKKSTKDSNGKRGFIKFSIRDSQNSFLVVTPTALAMELTLKKMAENGPIQPCLLVVGSLFDPKQILVYLDNIKYKMFSAYKAFDICFKIFHVFNVEYPLESGDVWLFIQTFFYNITTKYDKSNVVSKQISNELKSKLI